MLDAKCLLASQQPGETAESQRGKQRQERWELMVDRAGKFGVDIVH